MVEVGELEVIGRMDDTDIDKGFNTIGNDFKKLENQANQTNVSFKKMAVTSAKIAASLIAIGGVGVAGLTALATKSPVLAGTMAKMELAMLKLSMTIGRQLKPVFEYLATDLIPSVNRFFQENEEILTKLGETAISVGGFIQNVLVKAYKDLATEAKEAQKYIETGGQAGDPEIDLPGQGWTSGAAGLGALAVTKNPVAAAAVAALTYAAIDQMERTTEFQTRVEAGENPYQAMSRSYAPGFIGDFYAWIFGLFADNDRKNSSLSSANGVNRSG